MLTIFRAITGKTPYTVDEIGLLADFLDARSRIGGLHKHSIKLRNKGHGKTQLMVEDLKDIKLESCYTVCNHVFQLKPSRSEKDVP
jgi:hypothetical protein